MRDSHGQEVRLPRPRLSEPIRRQALFWVNRLSFGDVALLIQELTGAAVLSEDGLWRLAQGAAQALDERQRQQIEDAMALAEPGYTAPADIYEDISEARAVEFVTMTDGIGVKSQKPTREKRAGEPTRHKTEKAKGEKRHDTDVLLLPRKDGSEQIVCEGVSGHWSLVEAARAFLRREWGGSVLSVVALTDGAKTIRADLSALFGTGVRVILDWYHLSKRVYQQLSMAAHSMKEREGWEQAVLALLWRGDVAGAEKFLAGVVPRNGKALSDLLGYLDKHREEIIDYERRQKAGKPIGSGRMEKCVDQVVGHRQKGKGMSWTKQGSRALALLKMAELNAR
jgi:hypothetical protein